MGGGGQCRHAHYMGHLGYVSGQTHPQGCIGRGGAPPPPSMAPSLCPDTVSFTPSATLNGMCNRQ